jgi:hypothetical protein
MAQNVHARRFFTAKHAKHAKKGDSVFAYFTYFAVTHSEFLRLHAPNAYVFSGAAPASGKNPFVQTHQLRFTMGLTGVVSQALS